MNEVETRFKLAYDALLEDMPDPPSFDDISTPVASGVSAQRTPVWVVVAASLTLVVAIGGIVVLFSGPGTDDSPATATTNTVETPRESVPTSTLPGIVIAEGVHVGSDIEWQLTAFEAADGSVCLGIGGTGCVQLPDDTTPGLRLMTFHRTGGQWCVLGPVVGAESVELGFPSGQIITTPIYTHPSFDVDFYAYCGIGDEPPVSAWAVTTTDTATTRGTDTATTLGRELGEIGWDLPWSLIFDNGLSGVLAVDTRNLAEPLSSPVEGQRPGDQPYRISVVDGRLIVGWGDIYAHDITTLQSTRIGEATIYVPAAEPDRVWLVDYPGGRINTSQPPFVWQVLADGTPVTAPVRFETEDVPSIGIPGGLAASSEDGIVLWSYTTGEVIERLGSGLASVSDVSRDPETKLAWCEEPCSEMHVTTLGGGEQVFLLGGSGQFTFDAGSARFSPDGRYLAAPAGGDLIVMNLETRDMTTVLTIEDQADPDLHVGWSPTGSHLFAATNSWGQTETIIATHNVATEETQLATLPYGGINSFVVIDTADAARLFDQ